MTGSSISGQLGMAIETTPGTRIAPTTWAEFTQESLTAGRKWIRSKAVGGGGSIAKAHSPLGQEPGGQVTMEGAAENIGKMLRMCFGSPVTTGPVSTVYTHTFVRALSTPLPTATIQVGRPDVGNTVRAFDYIGMMAAAWEATIVPDDFVMFSYDLAGRRAVTDQTLGTPTWPTLTPWTSLHVSLNLLGGVECFDSLIIRGSNNLDMSAVVCSTNPGERRVREKGRPSLGGTFVQDFEDMGIYDAFVAGTVGDLVLTLNAASTAQLIITGRVQFVEDNTPQISGPEEILKQSANFEFVRETTDTLAFNVVLKNTTATL